MRLIKLICLTILLGVLHANAQNRTPSTETRDSGSQPKKLALTLAYFGETLTHPGLNVGVEYRIWKREKVALLGSGNLGWYTHPRHHQALFFNVKAGLRRTASYGLFGDWFVGIGYRRSWVNGDIYVSDGPDDVQLARNTGSPHLMVDTSFGMGWDFSQKGALPLDVFVRLNPFITTPVNHNMLIQVAVTAGINWSL